MGYCQGARNMGPKDDQPVSPYQARPITIYFRENRKSYTVPEYFVERLPTASQTLRSTGIPSIYIDRADEDIGHTIVHWLYTGEYETLQDPSSQGIAKARQEYRRAVHTFCFASCYHAHGLAKHAWQQMHIYESSVDLIDVLAVAKEMFPRYEAGTGLGSFYRVYLKEKIMTAFKVDRGYFNQKRFTENFGKVPELDKLVVESVISLYSLEFSRLEQLIRSGDDVEQTIPCTQQTGEAVHGKKCTERPLTDSKTAQSNTEISERLAPDYQVSSTNAGTLPSDSEGSWSDLDSLRSEIDRVDYWKD